MRKRTPIEIPVETDDDAIVSRKKIRARSSTTNLKEGR